MPSLKGVEIRHRLLKLGFAFDLHIAWACRAKRFGSGLKGKQMAEIRVRLCKGATRKSAKRKSAMCNSKKPRPLDFLTKISGNKQEG